MTRKTHSSYLACCLAALPAVITAALCALLVVGASGASAQSLPTSCDGMREIKRSPDGAPYVISSDERRTTYCIRESDVKIDCQGHTLSGAPWWNNPTSEPAPHAFRIIGNVQNVEIRNCKIVGYERGVEIGIRNWAMRRADDQALLQAFRDGTSVVALEDQIRAKQPRYIRLIDVDIEGGEGANVGVYVFPYTTFVTYAWGKISGMPLGIYLDSGSQHNWITDSEFVTLRGEREAIAIDASAYNKILRNGFSGGAGIHIYKNCGEDLTPRFQWARSNRIRANTFVGMTTGVSIGLRADKLYHNRKAGERFDDTVVVDGDTVFSRDQGTYSWYCADRPYRVPSAQQQSGQSIVTMSWLAPGRVLPTFLDQYPRYAYYRERAPDNVVRCNSFLSVSEPIKVADDRAFIQNNYLSSFSGPIVVGSTVRSGMGEPVANVNVVGNSGATVSVLAGATGTVVRSQAGIASQWSESETCDD